jgi:hypothetical protein
MPLYPQNVASQGACPNFLHFCYFHFRLTFESLEEGGSVLGFMWIFPMLGLGVVSFSFGGGA